MLIRFQLEALYRIQLNCSKVSSHPSIPPQAILLLEEPSRAVVSTVSSTILWGCTDPFIPAIHCGASILKILQYVNSFICSNNYVASKIGMNLEFCFMFPVFSVLLELSLAESSRDLSEVVGLYSRLPRLELKQNI
jgi:hypothetical protein